MADARPFLGRDAYIGPVAGGGVDLVLRTCQDAELVRNGWVARCMSDTISMVGAPGGFKAFGKDLRALVGAAMGPSFPATLAQEMAAIFARDPRADAGSIRVSVTLARVGGLYSFFLQASGRTTAAQPIPMINLGIGSPGVVPVTADDIAQQTRTA